MDGLPAEPTTNLVGLWDADEKRKVGSSMHGKAIKTILLRSRLVLSMRIYQSDFQYMSPRSGKSRRECLFAREETEAFPWLRVTCRA